jgi:hypothetical protein
MNALVLALCLALADGGAEPGAEPGADSVAEPGAEPVAADLVATSPGPRSPSPTSLPSPWRAPDTGSDTGVFVGAQVFSAFELPLTPLQQDPWSRFTLERAEVGGGFMWERTLHAVLRLEAIRSASPRSAFGIDRNSLLPRFRLAWAGATPRWTVFGARVALDLRAGLVPEPWLERLEGASATRGLVALPGERARLIGTSDLGATASLRLNEGLVDIVLSLTNGEGNNEVEQNAGKNLQAIVGTTPVVVDVLGEPVSLSASAGWRDGSVGLASVRNHRGLLALTASHPWFHVGAESVWALGVDGRPDRELLVVGAWADAPVVPGWLGVVVRGDVVTDLLPAANHATATEVTGGVFSDLGLAEVTGRQAGQLLRRLRLYATTSWRMADAAAAPVGAVDAATAWRVALTVEVTGITDVFDPTHTRPSTAPPPGDEP